MGKFVLTLWDEMVGAYREVMVQANSEEAAIARLFKRINDSRWVWITADYMPTDAELSRWAAEEIPDYTEDDCYWERKHEEHCALVDELRYGPTHGAHVHARMVDEFNRNSDIPF